MTKLISTRQKWCKKIINREKTEEVRKTRPNTEPPFRCYIYQTKGNGIIGEFVCDRIDAYECSSDEHNKLANCGSCLTFDEIIAYCNGNELFAWHISELKIYDTPKELSEFRNIKGKQLTRPPQSWCYVEKLKEDT